MARKLKVVLAIQKGENVATTFTIFFTDDGQAPASLITMNGNIQKKMGIPHQIH